MRACMSMHSQVACALAYLRGCLHSRCVRSMFRVCTPHTHVCTLPHTPPIITKSAPPPIALATSPGHVIPPSLMMCPRKPCAASEHSITCVRVAARDLAACVLALVCVQITARRAQTHANTCRHLRPCTLCMHAPQDTRHACMYVCLLYTSPSPRD